MLLLPCSQSPAGFGRTQPWAGTRLSPSRRDELSPGLLSPSLPLCCAQGLISSGNQAKNTGAARGRAAHHQCWEPLLSLSCSSHPPIRGKWSFPMFLLLPSALSHPVSSNQPLPILTAIIGVLFGGVVLMDALLRVVGSAWSWRGCVKTNNRSGFRRQDSGSGIGAPWVLLVLSLSLWDAPLEEEVLLHRGSAVPPPEPHTGISQRKKIKKPCQWEMISGRRSAWGKLSSVAVKKGIFFSKY